MLRIEAGPGDVAASRFAVSPCFELAALVRTLSSSSPGTPLARRFAAGAALLRDDPAAQAFAHLEGPGFGATFAAPPPVGMGQSIEDDLAAIRSADEAVVQSEVERVRAVRRPSPAVAAVLGAGGLRDRVADVVARLWRATLGPEWPRVRAVLERDVRYRAERLTEVGWSAAVSGVHPRLRWQDGAIEVAEVADGVQDLGGDGLLLVPSVFIGQGLAVYGDPPWRQAIVYPCRGAGLVFDQAVRPTDPLAPLLGRTRAGLLLALALPASTTQLAAMTSASLGATGDHLRVLLDAGLVTRERSARSVVYRRTPLGDALAAAT